MNIDLFNLILSRENYNTGSFKIYHNFSNIFNDVIVFNELFPTGTQYVNNKLFINNNPGIIVGYNPSGFNDYSGSGFFQGDTILRLGRNINLNDWTLFLNFETSGCDINRNLSTVLISNKKNISDASGFCFGLNGANRFFIENTTSGITETFTSNFEAYQTNCISLSKINNKFEIDLHDILNESSFSNQFNLNNYIFSNEWFLGNSYDFENKNYTGFVGYFDDFILISGFIGAESRKKLAKSIFYSGYIPAQVIPQITYYPIYSTTYNPTGEIGVVVTGYEEIGIGDIPAKNGPISMYDFTGRTGFLYGEKISLISTGESGSITINQNISEQFLIDTSTALNYSSNYIKFIEPVDEKDILEIYNFEDINKKNLTLDQYDFTNNSILLNEEYSGQNINLNLNGVLQQSTTGQIELNQSGDYYLSTPRNVFSNNFYELNPRDKLIYYKNNYGASNILYYDDAVLYNVNITGKELYLNGQKLISGINYVKIGNNVDINTTTTLATGIIYVTDDLNNYISYFTGFAIPPFFNINYVNEKIFLNGILQELDADYTKHSCLSLLTGNFIKNKQNLYIIYNNDTGFFNY